MISCEMRKATSGSYKEDIIWREVNIPSRESASIPWLVAYLQHVFQVEGGECRGKLIRDLKKEVEKKNKGKEESKEKKNIKVREEFAEIMNDICYYTRITHTEVITEIPQDDIYFAYLNVRLTEKSKIYMERFIEFANIITNAKEIEASEDFKKNSEESIKNLRIYYYPVVTNEETKVKKYSDTHYRIYWGWGSTNESSSNKKYVADETKVSAYSKEIKDSIEYLSRCNKTYVSNKSTYICMNCEEFMELGEKERLELAKKQCHHILCSECKLKCPYCGKK